MSALSVNDVARTERPEADRLTLPLPSNASSHGGCFLKAGDVVESELTYVARQRNTVVTDDAGGRTPTYGPFVAAW